MIRASCLCTNVTWELDGPFELMSHCHCSRCRKTHGTAFATYVAAPAAGFRLTGQEHVARWESSPGFLRCFCRQCGSVIPSDSADGRIFAPAGNFETDPGVRPLAHIFVASKAPWYEIRDGLPCFDAYPPGFDIPVVADRAPLDPAGAPRGSCLCGGVAYVISGKPRRAFHCHCSRCRRGRSAAHSSTLFATADSVQFTRGEDLMVSYKLPEAKHFTQVFCRVCGSLLPRIDTGRNMAAVPMGGLDDDPGIRPQGHVFVSSKAPWFDIADDLPQYAEYPV